MQWRGLIGLVALICSVAGLLFLQNRGPHGASADMMECVSRTAPPDQRITACTAIIRAGTETKHNIAAAHFNRGVSYNWKTKPELSILDFEDVAKNDPGRELALRSQGHVLLIQGAIDDAIIHYNKALKISSADSDIFSDLGRAYAEKGDSQRAIAEYTEAIRLNPMDPANFYNRAVEFNIIKEFDKSMSDYNQSISLNQSFSQAYEGRASVYINKKQYDHAIDDLDIALKLDPNSVTAYYGRCVIAHNKRDYKGVILECSKTINIDPNYFNAYRLRAMSYRLIGEEFKAGDDLDMVDSIKKKLNRSKNIGH